MRRVKNINPETGVWVQASSFEGDSLRISVGQDDFILDSIHLNLEDVQTLLTSLVELFAVTVEGEGAK